MTTTLQETVAYYNNLDPETEKRVDALLAQMTLVEDRPARAAQPLRPL